MLISLILYLSGLTGFWGNSGCTDPQIQDEEFYFKLAMAAEERSGLNITYDPSYYSIEFPDGDIPSDKGVCTDLIIRAYRSLDIDLQLEVNKDMSSHFGEYPQIWGLSKPDPNIDHRRVPNLMTFFERNGKVLLLSDNAWDYRPGDLVTWDLGGGIPHIGIVSTKKNSEKSGFLIVHNIGYGPNIEDILFTFTITGHYRYP